MSGRALKVVHGASMVPKRIQNFASNCIVHASFMDIGQRGGKI